MSRACNPNDLEGVFNLHEINDRIWMVDGCSVVSGPQLLGFDTMKALIEQIIL